MLFTNFLKTKGKENQLGNSSTTDPASSAVLKPTISGLISNIGAQSNSSESIRLEKQVQCIKQPKPPIFLRDPLAIFDSRKSNLTTTMANMKLPIKANKPSNRVSTEYYNDDEDPNPLHRLEERKLQAKERSRSFNRSQSQSKLIIGESSRVLDSLESQIIEEEAKPCINCDGLIPLSKVEVHEKDCAGFEKLLKMSKQQLFMFVHGKIARDQVRLDEVRRNTRLGVVIGDPHVLITELQCRINHLHRVRNGIMTKLS